MWFNYFYMSSEQVKINDLKETPNKDYLKVSNRVDINDLMLKVRNEQKKEKKENLVFLGLVGSVLVISGVIASL